MTEIETVPLPREKIREKRPVSVEIEPDAMPGNRFRINFDWNGQMERFVMRIRHVETGTWLAHGPAKLMWQYDMSDDIAFILFDPTRQAERVTPENLGGNVRLGVFPLGPGDA